MYLPNSFNQTANHRSYRADGTIAVTNTPQLVLPQVRARAMFMIMNIGNNNMYLEHGTARAKATISGGAVTSVTILNGGFGYKLAPTVQFVGGSGVDAVANSGWDGRGQMGFQSPSGLAVQGLTTAPVYARPAQGIATVAGGVITAITITDGGAGYVNNPEVLITNNVLDPFGCASPYYSSTYSGLLLPSAGGSYYVNGTACWTDAISIVGTANDTYTVEYMP